VLREAFRVLKPGGRFAVSDVVVRGEVPADVRRSMELWVGCIAGALEEGDYAARLRAAGFEEVDVDPWRIYQIDDARSFLTESGVDVDRIAPAVDGKFASAFIRARKPAAKGSIQIYDPALCCSTGVCGVEVDEALVSAAADVGWAQQRGATIERFNLAQQPLAFAMNPVVTAFLQRSGAEALPLVLVDGEVALAGRLLRWQRLRV